MSIVYNSDGAKFTADEVLWGKRELIDEIVAAALRSQTEAFIDMIIDTEKPEEITRNSVNETLRGVKESAREFLKDVLSDLENSIMARLEVTNYGAVVTGIKYDIAGDVKDIEVDVSVS